MFERLKKVFEKPTEKPAGDEGLDKLDAASNEFANAIIRRLQDHRGVHAETAITAAGSIAGNCLLRAAGHDLSKLTPGSAVFTDEVNEAGPKIVGVMSIVCSKLGINPQTGWDSQPPVGNASLRPGIELIKLLRPDFETVVREHRVGKDIEPFVAAAAAVKIIKMAQTTLNPEVGKAIAITSVVAGSKTVPYPD
ncbi:MAG: hypothetical protein EPO07_03615 [Verrucomicrobia bacterium]|nr:MAG: hypothetical protein EPO07_03615 [Verrucomicrobiota bacterium]